MAKYEMLYILDPETPDEAKEAVIAKFENVVTSNGGAVEKTEKWGMKKLQYPINHKTEGYYVVMSFEAGPTLVEELKRVSRITDEVVRRLITRL